MISPIFCILLKLTLISPLILAATHWVVTQDGRIAPQMDSMLQLEKPHDLMAFLVQEERITQAEALRDELFRKKVEFEQREERDGGALVEERLYATDPDCVAAGRKVTAMTIFESTFSDLAFYGVDVKRELADDGLPLGPGQPDCSRRLDFSMQAFEHLAGLMRRSELTMEPEASLRSFLPDGIDLATFGSRVAQILERDRDSWIGYNLAALFFRIQGDAIKALQCCRLALDLSPRRYKTIALVSMGNVLTHSHHHEDGVIVLHAAVDHAPNDPVAHYTLANSYALIGDLNRSLLCYENVMKLQPNLKMAVKKMHGIQCLCKLERALEDQHSSGLPSLVQCDCCSKDLNTLTELKDQQKKFEQWNQLQERIVAAQASVGQRLRSQLQYQEYRLRTSQSPTIHECEQYEQEGFVLFQCDLRSDMSTLETWGSAMMDLRNRLVDFQTQTDKIVDLLSLRSAAANQSTAPATTASAVAAPATAESSDSSQILSEAAFQSEEEEESVESMVHPLSESEMQRCPTMVAPRADQMPSVLLPLESEGFDIADLLNAKIGLKVDEDHPLPWYPPVCDKPTSKLLPYDELAAIEKRHELKGRRRDPRVQRHLLSYVKSDAGAGAADGDAKDDADVQSTAALAQVGQRILTAMRKNVGPAWLLNTLAGLYWRGQGKTANGIDCFRAALSGVPDRHAHLPLTNLAALLMHNGHDADALTLAEMAHRRHRSPANHFLLGLLRLLTGEYETSARHFRRTVALRRDFAGAEHYRLLAACLAASAEERAQQKLECRADQDSSNSPPRTSLACTSKADPVEDGASSGQCEAQVADAVSMVSSQEVAAIADTDDGVELAPPVTNEAFEQLDFVQDGILPAGLLRMGKLSPPLPLTLQQCQNHPTRSRTQFTSTWLSVAAKNVDFKSLLPKEVPESEAGGEPVCDESLPASMATMDHLKGVRHRDRIDYRAESALEEALHSLVFDTKTGVHSDQVAAHLNYALKNNATSWALTTAASLYWRVKGDVKKAIDCLRVALHHAPYGYKDIPLISLANILHRAGLYNDALVSAYMALEVSPTFVVVHFTTANIHAARGDVVRALGFYQSTLSLQPSFEPARQSLIDLQCKQLLLDEHATS